MSEITEVKTEETVKVVPVAIQIRNEVKEQVQSADIRSRVVAALVEAEAAARADILSAALVERKKLEGEIRKVKPEVKTYDIDGNITSETYTKQQVDDLKKLKEKLQKLDKELAKAITEADYEGLKNLPK